MELGQLDASSRRKPIPREGWDFEMPCDTAIVAIGSKSHTLLRDTTPGLEMDRTGQIVADLATGKTRREGIFAGGDIVTGSATVIEAMGAGRRAAQAIDEYPSALPRDQEA